MKYRRALISLAAVCFCSIALFLCVYNNCESYDTPIAKITKVSEKAESSGHTAQALTGVLKNGRLRGETISLTHTFEESMVYDDRYARGNFLFVSIDPQSESSGTLTGTITGVKRDYYIALTLLILLDLLILAGGKQGLLTILGLGINIALFCGLLTLYGTGPNVLALSIVLVLLFSSIVLVLINGFNRRTLASLCATLGSVAVVGILSALILWLGPAVSYEFMEYLPEPYTTSEANLLFLSEILIGGLGVIMDIAVTITACSAELLRKDPRISKKALLLSCRQVADDITGTMINVVFFTNVASCIPVFLLSMKNGIQFFTVLRYNAFFEIARFLTGSIGIIITIPLAMFAASCFMKGGARKCS